MTSIIKKAKGIWHYARYALWGIRTNPKPAREYYAPAKPIDNPNSRFKNSSIADIIQTNIECRQRDDEQTVTSNADLLRRLKERQAK